MTPEDVAVLARGRIKVTEEGEHHCMIVLGIGGVRREIPYTSYTLPSTVALLVEAIQNAEKPLRAAMEKAMQTTGIPGDAWDALHLALAPMTGVTPIKPAAPSPAPDDDIEGLKEGYDAQVKLTFRAQRENARLRKAVEAAKLWRATFMTPVRGYSPRMDDFDDAMLALGTTEPSPAPGEAIEAIREALGNGAAMGLRACASMAERAQAIQHFGEPSDTWRLQERASRDACDAIETKLRAALASLEGKEAK